MSNSFARKGNGREGRVRQKLGQLRRSSRHERKTEAHLRGELFQVMRAEVTRLGEEEGYD